MPEIFSPSSVGRRRRSSIIFLFRHRDRPVKKIKFSPFFKNKQSFLNSRFLGKMSARDFFAVVGGRRHRSSVILAFLQRDGRVKKNQIFTVFQKQATFPKFKIFRQNEYIRFFHRLWLSPSSVIRHFPLSSQGRTCEKNQIFAVFKKQAIFLKFKIFRQNECPRFFRRHRLSPSSVAVGRPSFSSFITGDGRVEKIKFSPFFKNKQSFLNSRFLGKMSARDFFAVVGCRRRRSSVIFLFRHRDGPVKKI